MFRTSISIGILVPALFGAILEVSAAEEPVPGSQPLDAYTEFRIRDYYLEQEVCPARSHEKNPLWRTRCEYLIKKQQERHAARQEEFDPSGPGSEPLDALTETRLRRYITTRDSCPTGLHESDEVRTRCDHLLRQHHENQKLVRKES